MTATNSKWYLRVAPDEVYEDPCSRKANFAVTFARVNQESLDWQLRLEPVKDDMEAALAALAGPPYEARQVGFALPDFIDIVLNAGDSRTALGATVGQSLPNWGPVSESGGRTVAMTNLYTDPDSEAAAIEQARSLLCRSTADRVDPAPRFMTLGTVLHEAAHNLGPAHEYRVDGKTEGQVFGIKSRGDRALAEKTRDEYVASGNRWADLRGVIEQRSNRAPKASFVYAIE